EALAGRRIDATQAKADADAAAKGSKPNEYGVPADQWARWSTLHRKRWIEQWKKDTGTGSKGSGKGKGAERTPQDISAGVTQVGLLKGLAELAKAGKPFVKAHGEGDKAGKFTPKSRADAAKKIIGYAGDKLKDPVLVSAALDAIYSKDHVISWTVEKRLR